MLRATGARGRDRCPSTRARLFEPQAEAEDIPHAASSQLAFFLGCTGCLGSSGRARCWSW
eukprot:8789084-Lingulodinium_polyedra.AAC.1